MFQKKVLLIIGVICVIFFFTVKLNHIDNHVNEVSKGNNSFSPNNIICQIPLNPDWQVKMSDDLISFVNVITQQPFHWLSKGFQAYAFVSQDDEYVIKFFQQGRLRDRAFSEHPVEYFFSKSYRQKMAQNKDHRREIFSSSKIAFEDIPEETGILFVHLNPTQNLLHGVRLVDCLGQSYKIKPGMTSFLIQRKAQYILPTLTELMKKGDITGAKARIDQIFDLLLSLAKKHVVDSDYALIRNNNIGFIKNRCIYIDTGHITKQPDLDPKKQMDYEFRKRLRPLYDWLKVKYPELAEYYNTRRHEILTSLEREEQENLAKGTPEKVPAAQ
jgi:hypothetical protein